MKKIGHVKHCYLIKAVGDGPAGQAMAGPEFAISHSNLIAYCQETMKAIV